MFLDESTVIYVHSLRASSRQWGGVVAGLLKVDAATLSPPADGLSRRGAKEPALWMCHDTPITHGSGPVERCLYVIHHTDA